MPRLSCEKVETVNRPLRIPVDLYEVAKEANALESALRPVNSTLVEAIACGLPVVIRRLQARNRELRRYLGDTVGAAKLPATRPTRRGNCRSA